MKSILPLLVLAIIGYAIYQGVMASRSESSESKTTRKLPATVQHALLSMPPAAQTAFFAEFDRKRRKISVGYLTWIIGFHYLYARKVGVQFLFWFTFGGFGIWWFVDLFRIPPVLRSANEQAAREALATLGIAAAFAAPIT
jgi:hypothetical protein